MELPTPADLKERRKELELTQSELAEMADVSQPLIARIEGGDVDPRLSTLRRIVNALQEAEGNMLHGDDLMTTDVVTIGQDDSVREAIDMMLDAGYSQLPVVRDGYPVGVIRLGDIRGVDDDPNAGDLPVAEVMVEGITTVTADATLDEIDSYLDHQDAVVVVDRDRMVGIITDADVAAHIE